MMPAAADGLRTGRFDFDNKKTRRMGGFSGVFQDDVRVS